MATESDREVIGSYFEYRERILFLHRGVESGSFSFGILHISAGKRNFNKVFSEDSYCCVRIK